MDLTEKYKHYIGLRFRYCGSSHFIYRYGDIIDGNMVKICWGWW